MCIRDSMGLAEFVRFCKARVLRYAAVITEQTTRLGNWMDWNDPAVLRRLADLLNDDPNQVITVPGPHGPVTDTVEQIVARLGMPELGGPYFTCLLYTSPSPRDRTRSRLPSYA